MGTCNCLKICCGFNFASSDAFFNEKEPSQYISLFFCEDCIHFFVIFCLDEAESILSNEQGLIAMPGGPVTFEDVENARQAKQK